MHLRTCAELMHFVTHKLRNNAAVTKRRSWRQV